MNEIATKAVAAAVVTIVPLVIKGTVSASSKLIERSKSKKRAAKEQARFDEAFEVIVTQECDANCDHPQTHHS